MRRPTTAYRQLALLAVALVLAMSTWFSTTAVGAELRSVWNLSDTKGSWLTIVVQIGFVIGALLSAASNIADRIAPLRLVLIGALGAAATNALVVVSGGFGLAVVLRLGTGAFLALVYPPAMKAMSTWFREDRGFALGAMVGALTTGSALPHLINGLGGLGWQETLLIASGLTVVGGLIAEGPCKPGPYSTLPARFDPRQIRAIVGNREFRLATTGYLGHMWELYAMWAWVAAFYADVFDGTRTASFAAFAVISAGAFGAVYAGRLSDREGREVAAGLALRWSAAMSIFVGFLVDVPWPIVLAAGLVWGFWVVADSAQFSTIVTETSPRDYVGTALTIQLASGFVLAVSTVFLVPLVRDATNWGVAFLMLAPGPIIGAWAMAALRPDTGSASAGRPPLDRRGASGREP